jgi:transcriptional regulator with XRE-family HTH domain
MDTQQHSTAQELPFHVEAPRDFGTLLRRRRELAGLTYSGLARKAGLTRGTVRNIEEGVTTASPTTVRRLASVPALRLQTSEVGGAGIERPDWQPDAWFAPQYNPLQIAREMYATLNGPGGQLDQTYLYLDPQSASDWHSLCNGERYTTAFRAQVPFDKVAERMLRESRGAGLDVDALGSGDGKTETMLMQRLADLMPSPPDLRLYLLDISHTLLSTAYRYASDALAERRVAVFPLHGNFHDIARMPVLYYHPAGVRRVRVFALLGNSVANLADETRFFRDLAECAVSGDLALVDLQTVRAPVERPDLIRENDPPIRDGQPTPSHVDWLSGPLQRHCRGIKAVKLRMELALHCPVPGSYSADCMADVEMHEGPPKRFLVWRIKRYDTAKLGDCLTSLGWEPIQTWQYGPGKEKMAAVMLLRRRG